MPFARSVGRPPAKPIRRQQMVRPVGHTLKRLPPNADTKRGVAPASRGKTVSTVGDGQGNQLTPQDPTLNPAAVPGQGQGYYPQGGGDSGGGGGGGGQSQSQDQDQDQGQSQQQQDQGPTEEQFQDAVLDAAQQLVGEMVQDQDQSQDQASADTSSDDGSAMVANGDPTSPLAAYVCDGRLCGLSIARTAYGAIPVAASVKVSGVPNGPARFGQSAQLDAAVAEMMRRLHAKSEQEAMRLAAESTVICAREGDQVAMATIREVAENAKAGDERARTSYALLKQYIDSHPPEVGVTIFGEDSIARAAVTMANGPPIDRAHVNHLMATFGVGQSEKKVKRRKAAIAAGITSFGAEPVTHADLMAKMNRLEKILCKLGTAIGMAMGIQSVRNGGPISAMCEVAGAELGE